MTTGIPTVRDYPIQFDPEDLRFRMLAALNIAGISAVEAADYLGLNRKYVSNILNSDMHPVTLPFLLNFAALCQCSILDLVPFADKVVSLPYSFSVTGGGATPSMSPNPFRISLVDPENVDSAEYVEIPRNEYSRPDKEGGTPAGKNSV